MSAATANLVTGSDMLAAILAYRARVTIRAARLGEEFPSAWELGFDLLGSLDPEWVWVAERSGTPLGALVASPAHGVAVIWRVVAPGPDSALVTRRLLHAFLRDLAPRGLVGYLTMLNLDIPTQGKLSRVIERAGGKRSPVTNLTLMAGPIPKESITCHL
jgi:hypothetical protein